MHCSPHQLSYFADKPTSRGATDSMWMASALLETRVELKAQFPKLSDSERDFPSLYRRGNDAADRCLQLP
jgi:hypothetical protein